MSGYFGIVRLYFTVESTGHRIECVFGAERGVSAASRFVGGEYERILIGCCLPLITPRPS
jgi:hypothetical protein